MDFLTQNYLTRGFWGDEAWTTLISKLPLSDLIRTTAEDFHPPLYYLMVHYWIKLFGDGELVVRLVSTIAFLGTLIIAFFLAKQLLKSTTNAMVAVSLMAVSPILFTYAFEARAYAVLTFLSVTSSYVFWRAKEKNKSTLVWKFLYFILGAISIYTHYYAWFVLFSHGLYLLLFERKNLVKMLPPAFAIGLAQLPWLPTFLTQINQVKTSYWIGAINERTHWEFFLRATGGDNVTIYQRPIAVIALVVMLMGLMFRLYKKKLDKPYLFLLSWLIIPTLIPSLISMWTPIFFYRYLIFSIVPIVFLYIDAISFLPKRMYFGFALLMLVGFSAVTVQKFMYNPLSMRQVVAEWEQQGDSDLGLPLYTVLPSFAEAEYYLGEKYDLDVLPEGLIQFSGKSLLDTYVANGWTRVEQPGAGEEYWLFEPGPKVLKTNQQ